jgi:hypothetical protein
MLNYKLLEVNSILLSPIFMYLDSYLKRDLMRNIVCAFAICYTNKNLLFKNQISTSNVLFRSVCIIFYS